MVNPKILVVEDELIVAKNIQSRLENVGYTVPAIVSTGEEAVEKAAEIQPDLVLMDIKLAGEMTGIEAAEQIKKRFNIPVIYLTAYGDEKTLQRAKITEPYGYILKPVNINQLYSSIKMALYKHPKDKKLKKSKERYRLLTEASKDVIWTADMKEQVTYVSPSVVNLRGYTPEEAITQSLEDIFTSDSLEVVKKIISEATSNKERMHEQAVESRTFELEMKCKDDSTVWTETTVSLLHDAEGHPIGIHGISRDITDRKRAEEVLRKSEKEFRLIFEYAEGAILCAELGTGLIIECNKKAEKLLKKKREEILGQYLPTINASPEIAEYFSKIFKKAIGEDWATIKGAEEEKNKFLKSIGPQASKKMNEAFYKLTGKKITVNFGNIHIYKDPSTMIDVNEKCYGSYITVNSDAIEALVFLFFPMKSASKLVELALKKQQFTDETISAKMKLSTFKEVSNILLLTYTNELTNYLGPTAKCSPPNFVHFESMKLSEYLPTKSINTEILTLIGKFSISTSEMEDMSKGSPALVVKGGFSCYISMK